MATIGTVLYFGTLFLGLFLWSSWKKSSELGYRSARSRLMYVAIQTRAGGKILLYVCLAILAIWGFVSILNWAISSCIELIPSGIDLTKPSLPEH